MVNFAKQAADKLAKEGISLHRGRPAHHLAARRRRPSWRRSRRPAGSWSSTSRIRAAAWPPTSAALVASNGFRALKAPIAAGHRAAFAGAVLAGARGPLRAEPGEDRGRRPRGDEVTGAIHPITMPKWGIEMQEGTVTAWHFAPGQPVHKGDALLEVETDKIVNSVEAPVSGALRRILGAPGEVRAVGALIGVFADAEVPESAVDHFIGSFVAPDASFEPRAPTSTAPAVTQATSAAPPGADAESEARVSPIARRLALELDVDLAQVTGTGRNGRVSKQDVEAWAAAHRASPASRQYGQRTPRTRRRASASPPLVPPSHGGCSSPSSRSPTSVLASRSMPRRSSRIARRCVHVASRFRSTI